MKLSRLVPGDSTHVILKLEVPASIKKLGMTVERETKYVPRP